MQLTSPSAGIGGEDEPRLRAGYIEVIGAGIPLGALVVAAASDASLFWWQTLLTGAAGGVLAFVASQALAGVWRRRNALIFARVHRLIWPPAYDAPRITRIKVTDWIAHFPASSDEPINPEFDDGEPKSPIYTLQLSFVAHNKDKGSVLIPRDGIRVRLTRHVDNRVSMVLGGNPYPISILTEVSLPPIELAAREKKSITLTLRTRLEEKESGRIFRNANAPDQVDGEGTILFKLTPRPGRNVDYNEHVLRGEREFKFYLNLSDLAEHPVAYERELTLALAQAAGASRKETRIRGR